ncbi:MAG TPA: oligopeptide/dipeptide ABC transporter ATP-binding protein [Conexibacter sp.]|nr:oligopeptide/dipeptide ABC transporter ATP-binding protein [Conexibacter sp.]
MEADTQQAAPGLRASSEGALLSAREVTKTFTAAARRLGSPPPATKAVDGISFDVQRGEILGVVGETGCGKSTLARCMTRLLSIDGGSIVFDGVDIGGLSGRELKDFRRRVQIVFQDPFATLDARMSVRSIVEEPLAIHRIGTASEREALVDETLALVGLPPTQTERKPHAFSGGQRQRIALARALVLKPELLVLDEPVSALDVSVQAQILNLLDGLHRQLSLTYVFIVHDLAVAEYFCTRIAVLYLGRIVELADARALFERPVHPYSVALLSAAPRISAAPRPRATERPARTPELIGDAPTAVAQCASGCRFRPRCPVGRDRAVCAEVEPPLAEYRSGHWAACHFPAELEKAEAPAA